MDGDSKQAGGEQPDVTVPSVERQAELEAAYQANVAVGKSPYAGVAIKTLGELHWVMTKRNWAEDRGLKQEAGKRADLSGADFSGANLSGARLGQANLSGARLFEATLRGADLYYANLSDAYMVYADLSYAILGEAKLSGADLSETTLVRADLELAIASGATLWGANLSNASLGSANLSGAILDLANLSGAELVDCRFDATTQLAETQFDTATRVADVNWNGAPLTRIAWESIPTLGDEAWAQKPEWYDIKPKDVETWLQGYRAAGRAYRQLSVALHSQGLTEFADNYAYRAQLMQREVFRWEKRWGGLFFSWFLFLVSGYGYRLWHILATYGAVVFGFTIIYWALGVHSFPHESGIRALWDSFLVSLSAIHGRTTFEQLGAWSSAAWTAAVESVVGIVIEGVFVAMLIQRFFTR